ncbi:tetratricopeptide repeat protein [Horticoccus luteus]|uniref:Tetratricopeptide repeat protein n=1 Tax=Horticoccus luteus TaxID=2862869 RepID=A0A8F9XKG6_9BACT|nr:tetratricopeptide repeat protein [Horticoccus luteus]QYM79673.1 tetratricopeptide repeat protein [Horticoccus luteus]
MASARTRRPAAPAPADPTAATATGTQPAAWACALLALAVLLAYLPALHSGFIWDDDGHVTRADLQSFAGLFRIWFEVGATQQYYPLLHSAFWLEHLLWGAAPLGYHLANIALHATAACLFARVLLRLAVPGAWFAAVLFALHPVCVESVAWISEQKNTLSAIFYLLGVLAYLDFDHDRRRSSYAWAGLWFVGALLTKTVTATLPAALLVVLWWKRGRLDLRRDVGPLLPWFLCGAAAGLFTAHVERTLIGAQGADFALSFTARLLLAGRNFWFYLGKLVWPADLIFIYPRWSIHVSAPELWFSLLAALALLAALVWSSRRTRAPLAAALLFGGTLFPALGFVNVYPFLFSYVADHFQYLASLGVFALLAAALWSITTRWPATARRTLLAALPACLGVLTWRQCATYRDATTLYQTTIARNPDAWLAYQNLAVIYANEGRPADALPLVETVLRLHPDYPLAENSLGDDLARLGRFSEALPHLQRAVQLEPRYFQAFNNLGSVLLQLDRAADAVPAFESALRLQPAFPEAENNLGQALTRLDRAAQAIPHFQRALHLRPDFADAELNWGIAIMLTSGFAPARAHFERAVSLAPDNPQLAGTYARALLQAGQLADAAVQLETVVRLLPDNAEAHLDLARVLHRLGRTAEANYQFQTAARLSPALLPPAP